MLTLTAEDIIRDKSEEPLHVSPDITIYEAVKLILKNKDTAVLVKKEDKIVGIWTERDLLRNIATEGFHLKTAKIGDYMSTQLISAPHNFTVFQLIDRFLGRKVRHLLIDKDGEYIGLLYSRDVIRAGLTERTKEFKELNEMVSWEYYEDWKWGKKYK
jgi:signal-transduction protein with cAMP-binding, CBS, and nucleotidyltransferase domain